MASNLIILAAAMAALVVLTHATIITTEESMGTRSCRRELRSKWPENCEEYMMEGMMMRYRDDDERRSSSSKQFDECCDDLMRMQPECQCEAMEMMIKGMEMRQRGEGQREMHHMMDKAMEIPMMCGTMKHRCHMSHMI